MRLVASSLNFNDNNSWASSGLHAGRLGSRTSLRMSASVRMPVALMSKVYLDASAWSIICLSPFFETVSARLAPQRGNHQSRQRDGYYRRTLVVGLQGCVKVTDRRRSETKWPTKRHI